MTGKDKKVLNPYRTEYEITKRLELLESLTKMMDGFYDLVDYGDDWWKVFSWSTFEDELIAAEWKKVDWNAFMDLTSKIQMIMMGAYCSPKAFVNGLKAMKKDGIGVYNL